MQMYNIRAEFIPVNLDIPAKLIDKTIQANGIYNASDDAADGYSSVTVVVPERPLQIQALNVTPSTQSQTIDVISGVDGYGPVSVSAVENVLPGNIKEGQTILGVEGTVVELDGEEISISPTTNQQIITPSGTKNAITRATVGAVTADVDSNIQPSNIKSGTTILGVIGNVVELDPETASVNPAITQQIITPTSPHNGLTQVTVGAVTSAIDANIQASNIRDGVTILGVAGNIVELNGTTQNITPTTSQQTITPVAPNNGFTEITVDAVTSSIDSNIAPENIKSGVSILGVNGSVTELVGSTETVSPTTSQQVLTPTSPSNAFTEVTVNAVTSAIDANIQAQNIRQGVSILGVSGAIHTPDYYVELEKTNAGMLKKANKFINLDNVTSLDAYVLYYMFRNRVFSSGTDIDMSGIQTINNSGFTGAFFYASGINSVDLSSLTTVYDYGCSSMLKYCYSITSADLSALQSITSAYSFQSAFEECRALAAIDLSSLKTINATYACSNMFVNCISLPSANISNLEVISGSYAAASMFSGATSIASADLRSLAVISGDSAARQAFNGCSALTSVNLSSLKYILLDSACRQMFAVCTSLASLSFPALRSDAFSTTTSQFLALLQGAGSCTIHFPKNLDPESGSTTISSLSGYPTFGNSNTVLAFDLPSTVLLTGANGTVYERNPKDDTASALAWRVQDTGTIPNLVIDWTSFYTSTTSDPQVGDTIYSDASCTTAVTTISSITG